MVKYGFRSTAERGALPLRPQGEQLPPQFSAPSKTPSHVSSHVQSQSIRSSDLVGYFQLFQVDYCFDILAGACIYDAPRWTVSAVQL